MQEMPGPGPARPVHRIARMTRVTLHCPSGPPIVLGEGDNVHGAGADPQTGTTIVVTVDPLTGKVRKYIGFPIVVDEEPPSGLLAVG